jgi:transcriptional regulator with XRE-family HTH domain
MRSDDEATFLRNVGNRVKRIREMQGLTAADFGIRLGMNPQSSATGVYQIENGKHGTQIDTLFRVANALGVTPGLLLDGGEVELRVVKREKV